MQRLSTKTVKIGNRVIGGGNPVLIQSMTNTKTEDAKATAAQVNRLAAVGCDIIRCAIPTMEAAQKISEIKKIFPSLLWPIFILITVWQLQQ